MIFYFYHYLGGHSMIMNAKRKGNVIVAIAALIFATLAIGSPALATITDELDSSSFDWMYEFNEWPQMQDLDYNGVDDFTLSGTAGYLDSVNGIWNLDTTTGGVGYFIAGDTGQIWQNNITSTAGYTVEARVRVNSGTDAPWGTNYIQASAQTAPGATGGPDAVLSLREGGVGWANFYAAPLDYSDNTDDFHVYRLAQEPGESIFSVWRDGVLLASNLGDGVDGVDNLNRLIIGDVGAYYGGNLDYDYLRFTSGAYAPVDQVVITPVPPTATLNSSQFTYKYEMDVDPTSVAEIDLDANESTDWGIGGTGSVTMTDHDTVIIDSQGESTAYLESGLGGSSRIWPNLAMPIEDGFTIEISLKVLSDLGPDGEFISGAFGMAAGPSAGGSTAGVLGVAADGQFWYGGDAIGIEGDTYNNTDDFHTFRLTLNNAEEGGKWYVWRDGELLTPEEGAFQTTTSFNALYLGDVGGYVEGSTEIEYIRFIPGAFSPGTEEEPIAGDANNDGKVDGSDVTILAGNWQVGVDGSTTATWAMGDFNGDGKVDGSDVTILAGNWQYGVTAAAAVVPEPSVILLILSAITAVALMRRRK